MTGPHLATLGNGESRDGLEGRSPAWQLNPMYAPSALAGSSRPLLAVGEVPQQPRRAIMSRPVFTLEALKREMRASDRIRFGFDWEADRDRLATSALQSASDSAAPLPAHQTVLIRGKPCVVYPNYETHLLFRVIGRYLNRRFRLRPANRDQVIRGVIESLRDATPMWVIRRDIASFYEHVPTGALQARLLSDTAIPGIVRSHLRHFFRCHSPSGRGLPRGVGLAAVLVELIMDEYDQIARSHKGVYRYFRYSDDILLFSSRLPTDIEAALQQATSSLGMAFNPAKASVTNIDEQRGSNPSSDSFEYLGYRFQFDLRCGHRVGRAVSLSIGPRKLSRLRTRVHLSLRAHERHRDHRLLLARLRFLTGNVVAMRRKDTLAPTPVVKSGLYFSYKLAGVYSDTGHQAPDCHDLKELDGFMHSLLHGGNSEFRAAVSTAPPGIQAELRRLSFFHGFRARFIHDFTPQELGEIRSVWKHVR